MTDHEWKLYRAHLRKLNFIFFGIGLTAGIFIGFLASLILK